MLKSTAHLTWVLPFLAVLICLALTFIATCGLQVFSVLADWLAKAMLLSLAALVIVPFLLSPFGRVVWPRTVIARSR
jgi:hypothetical protein